MKDGDIGDNSRIEVEFDVLEKALEGLADKKRTVSEATGTLRNAIKGVIEEHGWHKGAFADIRKIAGMSETQRADYLRSFEPLFEAMKEFKWDDEQEDLFDEDSGA
jgi:hypothetical protein